MGKPCSCMQFIKAIFFYCKSHENPYQYYKSRENPYQVLKSCTLRTKALFCMRKEEISYTPILTVVACSTHHIQTQAHLLNRHSCVCVQINELSDDNSLSSATDTRSRVLVNLVMFKTS